jgi:(E)-4-hydroxy-3-methylbut-2-enyl-diphosphate synthase
MHLGVTEAGDGEDGRVKSAIGIGSLLLDGIGDTIRVSLTEDPWEEIDPCKRLKKLAEDYLGYQTPYPSLEIKRAVTFDKSLPLHRDGSVYVFAKEKQILDESFYQDIGCKVEFGKPKKTQGAIDAILVQETLNNVEATQKITLLREAGISTVSLESSVYADKKETWEEVLSKKPPLIILHIKSLQMHLARAFFKLLEEKALHIPVILAFHYTDPVEDLVIRAAAEAGALLADGLGEGLCIEGPYTIKEKVSLAFNILQGCRKRSSKTEYIACPGCGRTLFGLQEVTKKIREKTAHLSGVKIAVMGCIVNGPGEMADADFGYVGSRPGKIDLYVGKNWIDKNIDTEVACERLVELIKSHGRWIEPSIV